MDDDSQNLANQKRWRRMRFLKKILRPLPRRSNLDKYPVLKWFAKPARNRSYMWEFKTKPVIIAIYIGCIIAFTPTYGGQMISAFIVCLFLGGNCIVAMALQWLTNPFTIPFFLVIQFYIGNFLIRLCGFSKSIHIDFTSLLHKDGFVKTVEILTDKEHALHLIASTFIGGFVIGIFFAVVLSQLYMYRVRTNRNQKQLLLSKNKK